MVWWKGAIKMTKGHIMAVWRSAIFKCNVARGFHVVLLLCAFCCAAMMVVLSFRSKNSSVSRASHLANHMDFLSAYRRQVSRHVEERNSDQGGLKNNQTDDVIHKENSIACTGTCYVTTGASGRLGNQMFEYASLLGIAHLNNRSQHAFYPTRSVLGTAFRVTHINDRSTKGFHVVDEKSFGSYDPKFENLPPGNVLVMQYFQSWKYFHHIRDTILKEFTFIPSVQKLAKTLIDKRTKDRPNSIKIGVHVRRRDYLHLGVRKQGFRTPPPSYFQKAAKHMREKHHDVIFLIVTDDVKWCERNLNLEDSVFVENSPPAVHLAVLASCDHVIMSAGTFGWWGGYMSGGDVIYYAKEVTPDSEAGSGLVPRDHYLPHWVGMED